MTNPTTTSSSLRSKLNSALSGLSEQLPAINSIQHSIRQQVVTHNPSQNQETLKLQLAITAQSAVVRDEEALAREQLAASKALFLWGQTNKDSDEVVDVTDRLGFLLYSTGEQFAAHARALEQSRAALKDIRNLENELVPRRRAHAALLAKLSTLEHSQRQKDSAQIAQLRGELLESHESLQTFESSLAAVRRRKLGEGFSVQFAAQRELGEKLAIIASYGETLLQALGGLENGEKYNAHEHTAAVRLEAAEAIKNWSPSNAYVPTPTVGCSGTSCLGRSDTRSFGSTHADALSHIGEPNFIGAQTSDQSTPAGSAQPATPSYEVYTPASPPAAQASTVGQTHSPRTSSLSGSTAPVTPVSVAPAAASSAAQFSTPPATPPTHSASSAMVEDLPGSGNLESSTPSASGITRMATTDRRRLQHSEQVIGTEDEGAATGDALPQYELMAEELSVEERERREAELNEAREREAKSAVASGSQ